MAEAGGRPPAPRALDLWHRLGMRIRLGWEPGNAALVRVWLAQGEALPALGLLTAWSVHERSLRLLLASAEDPLLPIGWRLICLDAGGRVLGRLGPLVHDDDTALRLRQHARRLASFSCGPPRSAAGDTPSHPPSSST